ncbi:MAG: tetratricopeptide repeat protein [Verrucomicrobiia bacterium]
MKPCLLLPLLLLATITLLPAQLPNPFVSEEKRAQTLAERAFQDALYDVARSKLDTFLQTYPNSPAVPQIRWLYGQALLFTGEREQALAIFSNPPPQTPPDLAASYALWVAETLAAQEKWAQAETAFRSWLQNHPNHEHHTRARTSLALTLFRQDKLDPALALLNDIRLTDLRDPHAQRAALLQVRILLAAEKTREADELLTELSRARPAPPASFETAYWSAELARARGDLPAARTILTRLVNDPRASPRDLVAQAHFLLGRLELDAGETRNAAESFRKAFTTAYDPATIQPALARFLETQKQLGDLTAGALVVREFTSTRTLAAPLGHFATAKFFADDGNLDAALLELDTLTKSFPNSEWIGPARLLTADILRRKGKRSEATALLDSILSSQPGSPLAHSAALQLAALHLEDNRPEDAAALFLTAAQTSEPAQAERALTQALSSFARAGRLDAFLNTETQLRQRFPKSRHLQTAAFDKARLLEASGQTEEARRLLTELARQAEPSSPAAATATLNLAFSLFRDGDYPAAEARLEDFLARFPNRPEAPEARFWLIQAKSLKGDLNAAAERTALQALLKELGTSPLAPQVAYQIGQSLFNEQNYGDAQRQFQFVAESFPNSPLADQAIYLAARSALNLGNHSEAITILERIKPDSPTKNEARLAQIRAYLLQGKPEPAVALADALLRANPQGFAFSEAHLRRTNALLALADLKASDEPLSRALDSLAAVLASPDATVAHRNEAGTLRGEILLRQKKTSEALEAFLDVVYGRLFDQSTGNAQPEYFWFIRAGTQAARIKLEQDDPRGAVAIYRILERLGGPSRKVFRDTIDDLRSRHFIWEDS